MPWSITQDHPDCGGWAVVKDENNELEGCHDTRREALDQLAALNAAEVEASRSVDDKPPAPVGQGVKFLGETEDGFKVGGYGVVFGGRDLVGEFFTKDTDFWFDRITDSPMVLYEHGLDESVKRVSLGRVTSKTMDNVGLWIEAQIQRHSEYSEAIRELVDRNTLGWSSGAVRHLIDTDKDGQIKSWPIVEFSLTPTPAEPRTLGVRELRSLVEFEPTLKAICSEDVVSETTSSGATATVTIEANQDAHISITTKSTHSEVLDMSEQTQDVVAEEPAATPEVVVADAAVLDAVNQIAAQMGSFAEAQKSLMDELAAVKATQQDFINQPRKDVGNAGVNMPNVNSKTKLGDDEIKAYSYWVRTGDGGAIRSLKASNDTTMNITTDADGGYAVPTGHHNNIIARRDEDMLAIKLGVRQIPGRGTTVNVPVDNEADGEFVSTAESGAFDRDAPALDQKAMTLVKYTKKVDLTLELLDDEDSRLLAFLEDFVGRGMAKTHNNLLLTEVATNGTSLKTFASATAIAAGEPEDIVGNADLSNYLTDDSGSVAWVMRSSTHMDIASLTGSNRLYAEFVGGSRNRELLGFPVYWSNKAAATAASAKDVYFGNWNFVGVRLAPDITVLRDPYSRAANGEILLHYYFRTDYVALQTEAVGYGVHPSA